MLYRLTALSLGVVRQMGDRSMQLLDLATANPIELKTNLKTTRIYGTAIRDNPAHLHDRPAVRRNREPQ